ncbi:hypothetical protein CRUP_022683 [Coryphaenoides rupestris]|nr:hypothetical protein CRUP_022683 [Coryphaenoides rupestris]
MSASSEESTGSWSQVTPEDDPHEETSSCIQLSEGNGTSSSSSVGVADLEAFSDVPSQSSVTITSAETGRGHLAESRGIDLEDAGLQRATESRGLLVLNCDLEPERVDWELRVALQWIAASELGLSALYFSKSVEMSASSKRQGEATLQKAGGLTLDAGLQRATESRGLLVLNCDLEPERVDWELRVALQWIAASELGLSALYFSKSVEMSASSKFQRVVLLVTQKAWRVADLFSAVLRFCQLREKQGQEEEEEEEEQEEEREEEGPSLSSLFDWLLETL